MDKVQIKIKSPEGWDIVVEVHVKEMIILLQQPAVKKAGKILFALTGSVAETVSGFLKAIALSKMTSTSTIKEKTKN